MQFGKCFLFQPTYASGSPASHRAFMVGAAKPGDKCWDRLILLQSGGSLLANTFNHAWTVALNNQLNGEDITHFAMLHDDVVPEDGWLNTLLEDMRDTGADMVSAVIPIKDGRGLTSTGIDGDDPFILKKRLTLAEVLKLPERFTAADCGYPDRMLLLNTGCWVCDFTKAWRFKTCFTINDRIIFALKNGKRLPMSEVIEEDGNGNARLMPKYRGKGMFGADVDPEDWNFSRQIQRLGAKVAATRRVKLHHAGGTQYVNYEDWGIWKYDQNLVAPPHTESEVFPGVKGWLTDEEGEFLKLHAANMRVLEIGSYCGLSALWMARSAYEVVTIDPHDMTGISGSSDLEDTYDELCHNLSHYKALNVVQPRIGTSLSVVPNLKGEFNFAFIDGAHDYDSVKDDYTMVMSKLSPDGQIVFHDYHSQAHPEVTQFVDEIVASGGKIEATRGYCVLITPPQMQKASVCASTEELQLT